MLVLSRKVDESILIGPEITVTVIRIGANSVRLGIEAPSEMAVMREELVIELNRPADSVSQQPQPTKDARMRIGVVSDTHGHVQNAQAAVRMLESLQVERVIHCGDIGAPEIVPMFAAWPTHFVFGNVDDADEMRPAIVAAGQTCHERFGMLNWEGVRIAVLHSDDGRRFRETLASGQYDLVCYGHTHQAKQSHHGNTLALNPGALYRANPHSLAVVELPSLAATIVPL